MAARKRTSKKRSQRKPQNKKRGAQPWKAPKNIVLALLSLPFRIIFNSTCKLNFFFRWSLRAAMTGVFFLGMAIFLFSIVYLPRAYIFYDMEHVTKPPARSLVYASDNTTELGRLHGVNRYIKKYDDINENFIKALLAQEDEHFFKHNGVHITGLLKIPVYFVKYKKVLGSSTITMQLARNVYPEIQELSGPDRKLLEIALALRIEKNYEKKEILEHYMNRIFFGHSMYGVEAASRAYFEKSAKDLNLSEAAMLAGIVRGPNLFSPFRSIEKATRERDRVLDRMVAAGSITEEVAAVTKREEITVTPLNRRTSQATYIVDLVDQELKLILSELKDRKHLKLGNLKVYTTIDHKLQLAAEHHMDIHLRKIEREPGYQHQTRTQWQQVPAKKRGDPKYVQGALVCIENKSGAILTMVGGRSAKESKLNRAKDDPNKRKQIGSIVKPFVYLTAFDRGLGNYIQDSPIGGVTNTDGKYYKSISVTKALSDSRNCAAVHAGIFAEKENVSETLRRTGFSNNNVEDASYFLGSGCATPWEVASAFTVFPNDGTQMRPYIIREIRDQDDNVIYTTPELKFTSASASSTRRVRQALDTVTKTGTARALQGHLNFRDPCGGKTGTSNNGRDAWFAGYTESITCAVWVGLDTPTPIMKDASGSKLALPIWAKIMQSAKNFGYQMIPRAQPVR